LSWIMGFLTGTSTGSGYTNESDGIYKQYVKIFNAIKRGFRTNV